MAEPRLTEIATLPFFRLTRFLDAWDAQGIPRRGDVRGAARRRASNSEEDSEDS